MTARLKTMRDSRRQRPSRWRARGKTFWRYLPAGIFARRLALERLEDRRMLSVDPFLLKDANALPAAGTEPDQTTAIGDVVYFTSYVQGFGRELWKTDGTATGTVMVKDIRPGGDPYFGNPLSSSPENLTAVGDMLYFTADDGVNGRELWRSDGTEAGTLMVKKIGPGEGSSPYHLTAVGHALYFTADDGVNGRELWRSDGTAGRTVMVKDILPGRETSWPQDLAAVGGALYFTANDGINGCELWKSDGTETGTRMLKDTRPGMSGPNPAALTAAGGTLYFTAEDGVNGRELWKSDGTEAGTGMVRDILTGSESSWPQELTAVGDTLYFAADDGIHGHELWRSDGTEAGTAMVNDIRLGAEASCAYHLTAVGNMLYFRADDGINGYELWKSNGTESGTELVKDILLGVGSSSPQHFTAVADTLYFTADDGADGYELWKSDGTASGTNMVRDILAGAASSSPQHLTAISDTLYFTADDGISCELWKSDGSEAGTRMVAERPPRSLGSDALWLTAVGDTLYFSADDGENGRELWMSDGTQAGTRMLKDIRPGSLGAKPENLAAVGDTLYFTANDGKNGSELWKSDGSEAGTILVKDIWPGVDGSWPAHLTVMDDMLYFSASTQPMRGALWKSDGTAAGTVMVANIRLEAGSSPRHLTACGDTLYFSAWTDGYELWKSDGTAAGTMMVKHLRPGILGANPDWLTQVNDRLYFTAETDVHGQELWTTDGTEAGTVMVMDIRPGFHGSPLQSLTAVGDTLYFVVDDGESGHELWRSDGTEAGTVMVRDIRPGSMGANPGWLTVLGDALYFMADDGENGRELWRSDGTEAGTRMIKDIRSGTDASGDPLSSGPIRLTAVGDTLYFSADDGENGRELWRSDGTAAGTAMVHDIQSGVGSSSPEKLTAVGDAIFFTADDGSAGREPWVLHVPFSAPVVDLGAIAHRVVSDLDLAVDPLRFRLKTSRAGILTLLPSDENVNLTLYDQSMAQVAASSGRLDYRVSAAASTYYVDITGIGRATLDIANLVRHTGPDVFVYGTDGDDCLNFLSVRDQFTFDAAAGCEIAINGVVYWFPVREATCFSFDGGPGDEVTICGSRQTETYTAEPGRGWMTGDNVSINVTAERIFVRGNGGGDTVYFKDGDGDDVLEYFSWWARMRGDGYFHHVRGFKTMQADAEAVQGDADRVVVRGSQLNDYLRVNPYNETRETSVVRFLSGSGSVWHFAYGFETIAGYGLGGALIDELYLNDTPGTDTFNVRRLQASLEAPDYAVSVATHGFGTVEVRRAYANEAADEISLGDSVYADHDDTVVGDPTQVTMSGPGYINKALNFPSVNVHSSGRGDDTAHLSDLADPADSRTGVDTFTGRPIFSTLEGPGYRLYARLFDEVHVESKYGLDIANLYGNVNGAELTGTAAEVRLSGTHSSGSYANHARSFHEVNAFGASDVDHAALTDAAVDMDSYGPPAGVPLDELAQILWLDSFEKIERWNSGTGSKVDDIDDVDRVFAWWDG